MSRKVVIGYDASATCGPRTGVGVYTAELLNALMDVLPPGWSLRALVNSPRHPLPDDPWINSSRLAYRHTRFPGRALLSGWSSISYPKAETILGNIDLVHSPGSWPIPSRCPLILSVHDLYFLRKTGPEDRFGGCYFAKTWPKLPEKTQIIVFSNAVKSELVANYPIDLDDVHVIPHGYRHRAAVMDGGHTSTESRYVLAVGTLGPRKNYLRLVEAFARMPSRGDLKLIIAGNIADEYIAAEIRRIAADADIADAVILTGYVSEERLRQLYRGCRFLAMVSEEEGFGLPILEAFADGKPVLASDIPTIREVGGNACLYVDPTSVECIAAEMNRMASDPALRERLVEQAEQRLGEFTWQRSAQATLDIYKRALTLSSAG